MELPCEEDSRREKKNVYININNIKCVCVCENLCENLKNFKAA